MMPTPPRRLHKASSTPKKFAPLQCSETDGLRYLHFSSPWIQGAMRIKRPDEIVLEYVQKMMAWWLFLEHPERIVQLGLGAAALTKFCYRQFPDAEIVAIELNPAVIHAAHTMFCLPAQNERLQIIHADAGAFISTPQQRHSATVLQVDLYDEHARGPVLDSVAFYHACRAALQYPGILSVNLFGNPENLPRSLANLREAFEQRVLILPPTREDNVIALAFNGPPFKSTWDQVAQRAAALEQQHGWPMPNWMRGLRQMNQLNGAEFSL